MRTAQRACRFAGEDSHRHLLALAIDMPFMTENYLRSICDAIEPGRGVVAKIDNRAEPLAAVYPREAEIDFRTALAGSDFSLQNVVHHLVTSGKLLELSVTEQERRLFRNVNNVSDVDATIAAVEFGRLRKIWANASCTENQLHLFDMFAAIWALMKSSMFRSAALLFLIPAAPSQPRT
jgi:hypothetical protein